MTLAKINIALFFTCYCICHVVETSVPPTISTTAVVVPPIHPGQIKVCNGSASDVIFVLDSSGSMGQHNFTVMKNFVKSLITDLEIGINANHVGVITFSQYPSIRIPLTAYMDKRALLMAVDRIPYVSGITETHLALELMRQEGFLLSRSKVPHIAIVMTDGKSFDEYKTLTSANQAHQEGITMFAVGIGMGIKLQELNNIATDPDANHVLTVTDFNSLTTIRNQLSAKTCTAQILNVTAPPTVPTTTATLLVSPPGETIEKCNQTVADLVFILDSSGSVGRDNFNILKQFVMNIVVSLDIGDQYTKVGVITFADYPSLRIPLGSFDDKTTLLNNINAIPYIPGITETDKALELLMREGFNGGRPTAPNVAIIITDGLSTHPDYTKTAAQDVKRAGVYMFSVGIGNDTSRTELNQLATLPDQDHVYEVQNFTQLSSIVSSLSSTTCIKAEAITTIAPPILITTASPVSHGHVEIPSPPTPGSTSSNESCHGRSADIFFLLDASSSVTNADFVKAKEFLKSLTSLFHIETSDVRVGTIAFSTNAHLEFNLGDYTTTTSIQSAMDNIIHYQGGTNTGAALELLRTTAVAAQREGVPQVAIVMTDGISRDSIATKVQARLAREANITLVAIGIGKTRDVPELNLIASPDASGNGSYVIEVESFGLLNSITDVIAYIACGFSVILNNPMTPQFGLTTPFLSLTDCKDTIDNCPSYGNDICSDYKPWAMSHCPYYCGFCNGPSTAPPICEDSLHNCHEYGTYICTSVELTTWTNTHCRKYCAFCGDGPKPTEASVVTSVSTTSPVCQDTMTNCREYGGRSVCTDPTYMSWAKTHCREYCGFCSNYVDYVGQKIGNITCPEWHLPKECTLTTVPGSCCPLPTCPDGYKLSALPPNQIKN